MLDLLLAVWIQLNDAKMELLAQQPAAYYYVTIPMRDRYAAQIAAVDALPGTKLLACCSLEECRAKGEKAPASWMLAYDLEVWQHSYPDHEHIEASVRAMRQLADEQGRGFAFIPCSRMMYDDNKHLIPILSPLVDVWIIQAQWFQVTGRNFVGDLRQYRSLIQPHGEYEPLTLAQVRMARYGDEWSGWEPWFPADTRSPALLFEGYVLPLMGVVDGILLEDIHDDTGPYPRPALYEWMHEHWVRQETPHAVTWRLALPVVGRE